MQNRSRKVPGFLWTAGVLGVILANGAQQAYGQAVTASGTVSLYNPNSPPLIKSGASGVAQISASCAQLTSRGTVVGYYTDTVSAGLSSFAVLPAGITLTPSLPVSVPTSTPTSPLLVNLRVKTSTFTPSGNYTAALVGTGTQANPNGPPCYAYYGSLSFGVFPTLALTHRALMSVTAAGSPATGNAPVFSSGSVFAGQLRATPATTQPCLAGGTLYNQCPSAGVAQSTIASNSGIFTLTNPANPGKSPNPGTLANLSVLYDFASPNLVRGYGAAVDFPTATFGLSCYSILLEADWGLPTIVGSTCKSLIYQGATYSGVDSNPFGGTLPGRHCRAFDLQLALTGAGQLFTNSKVKFTPAGSGVLSQGTVSIIAAFTGTQNVPLVAGRSGARDMSLIPPYTAGNQLYTLRLDQAGWVTMQDSGAGIAGYRVGLFKGLGQAACANYANPILVGGCLPATPGTNAACPVADSFAVIRSLAEPSPAIAAGKTDLSEGLSR